MQLDEIKALIASGKELPRRRQPEMPTGVTVCDIGGGKIVKYGSSVRPGEGEATRFVAVHTSIPVPKIYAVVTEKCEYVDQTYIVQEKIPGTTLLEALPTLQPHMCSEISRQITDFLEQLVALDQRGPGHLGVVGGSFKETGFFKQWRHRDDTMPQTPEELILYFAKKASRGVSPTIYEGYIQSFDYSCPSIFSHGDLIPDNIMVQDGRITGIIDWECAGWYPYFWNDLMWRLAQKRDRVKKFEWDKMIPEVTSPYPVESNAFSEMLWYADIFG